MHFGKVFFFGMEKSEKLGKRRIQGKSYEGFAHPISEIQEKNEEFSKKIC